MNQLIVVNDRSLFQPVRSDSAPGGDVVCDTSAHGLDRALLAAGRDAVFVGSARTPAQARLSGCGRIAVRARGGRFAARFVHTRQEAYRKFYDRWANRFMWLLHHDSWPARTVSAAELDAYDDGYRVVNQNIADAVLAELRRTDRRRHVFTQDYQLALVPALVRASGAKNLVLQHFLHVPFPAPGTFATMPGRIAGEILLGLLANDLVGFQTPGHAENFLACCADVLGLLVDRRAGAVRHADGRTTTVRAYPVPPDRRHLRWVASEPPARQHAAHLRRLAGDRRIVFTTGRVDPVKDTGRSLLAFARWLESDVDPGSAVYLAHLQPCRPSMPEWRALRDRLVHLAADTNTRFSALRRRPVELFLGDDIDRAVGGYLEYDVLDVVPRADGMNLVSCEGPLVNRRDGALVLSTSAGSHHLLGGPALGVPGGDLAGHVRALRRALGMGVAERARRAGELRRRVPTMTPKEWIEHQVRDAATAART